MGYLGFFIQIGEVFLQGNFGRNFGQSLERNYDSVLCIIPRRKVSSRK